MFAMPFCGWMAVAVTMLSKKVTRHLSASDRILDIGAGLCHVSHKLSLRGNHVEPIDIKDMSLFSQLRPRLYSGGRLPFADDEFDTALLVTVLHHTQNPEALLKEASRVASKLIVIEDLVEGTFGKAITNVSDRLINLELVGHPSTNKSDAQWRGIFSSLSLTVQDFSQNNFSLFGMLTSVTYFLKRSS